MSEIMIPEAMRPTALSPATIEGVRRLRQALRPEGEGIFSISKDLAPSPGVRAGLERRAAAIEVWLKPAGVDAVAPYLDLMLGTLRLQADSNLDADLRRTAYHIGMSDLPLFAVEAACTLALRGKVGDATGKWAPQPGELHKAAERAMKSLLLEYTDIRHVLIAKIEEPRPSKERRAEIVAQTRAKIAEAAQSASAI